MPDGNSCGTNALWEVREYLTADGFSPFANWFRALDPVSRARVATTLQRLSAGNPGDHRRVGGGVTELRLHWGPGYRLYFGLDGPAVVILLAGGSKRHQPADIRMAQERWQDYRARTSRSR